MSRIGILFVAATVNATQVFAQPIMPSERRANDAAAMPRDAAKLSKADIARRMLDAFGACLVRHHSEVARQALAGPRMMEPVASRVRAASDCIRSERASDMTLNFQGELLRGSIFKAYYTRDHKASAPTLAASPDWNLDFVGTSGLVEADQMAYVALRRVGACIVDADPSAVHALLLSDAGTPAEAASIEKIAPLIADCVPEGVRVELSRAILVGLLAEVAQRRSVLA